MMKLVFATNNDHKLREIRNVLSDNFKLLTLKDINLDQDIPENEPTLEGNAMYKARFINERCGYNVFADDTGLEIDELEGAPGVHSARYAGENKDFEANIDKVLSLLKNKTNRGAKFRTVIALIIDGDEYLFEGEINGKIIYKRTGTGGFGYDSIFIPDGNDQTFAEMSLEDKNSISHRAIAFRKLTDFLAKYSDHNNKTEVKHV
jgi:XTP/dITP diphosphohydrolase